MREQTATSPGGGSMALEREYDFRWRHPDREAILARYVSESERVLAGRTGVVDLAYGASPRERIDVFPAERSGAPVHIFFHGGYWRSHRKEDYRFLAEAGRSTGAATFVVEYDLAPQVTLDTILDQARRAILWVRARASDFNGDPARLVVSGHSAGGHLAAMLALTDWTAHGAPDHTIRGCLAVSGVFDLAPIARTSINDDLKLDAAAILRNSPIHHVRPGHAPITLAYGVGETDAFVRQSCRFAAALAQAGRSHRLMALPALHHYDIVLELGRPDSTLAMALCALLGNDG
ncbi:MAG TPA: alpha/beta hydrolase [Vineibacter sp.]|nr:alpha/beta hydrolase [Vineibacter sp.]